MTLCVYAVGTAYERGIYIAVCKDFHHNSAMNMQNCDVHILSQG